MNGTVDITPSPRVLRMLGQIDFAPWQCLAELIDNSIDAFIDQSNAGLFSANPRIAIFLPAEAELKNGNGIVKIIDNGPGMQIDDMKNAVKAGYSGNDPIEKMGLFGMGFNISTARLGRKTEVWSATADADSWVGLVIDFDELERNKTFHAPIQVKKKSQEELENSTHGTRIEISRLEIDRIRPLTWGSGKARTRQRLGKIYGRVMQKLDIAISYDGDTVAPWRHCVWDAKRTVPAKDFGNVPAIIEINEELEARRFCTTCWVWLTKTEDVCSSCGNAEHIVERKRTLKGWIGIQRFFDKQHYGIDLIRNGRIIEELDKSLFNFKDANGDELLEYPIDAVHWGGRFVGELEIDFVRVSHQKDSFDKLDPEWRHVVTLVRGDSPMQPRIAERGGFPRNVSPLARLFAGYRKGKAGLNDLVPGDTSGAGVNAGPLPEYLEKFYAGEAGFQDDSKWYDLVLLAERGQRGGSTGSEDAAGEFPEFFDDSEEDVQGGPESDESGTVSVPTETVKTTEVTTDTYPPDKDIELSRVYELEFLPSSPTIKVEAFCHKDKDPAKPFTVEASGFRFQFDYYIKSPYFEESLEAPVDCLVTDLAHSFLAISSETPRNFPVSYVARKIRQKYFKRTLSDVSSVAIEAESIMDALRRHYDDFLPEEAPIDVDCLDKAQVAYIRKRALAAELANEEQVEKNIIAGKFARYVGTDYLVSLLGLWPTLAMDGNFFSVPYKTTSEELRGNALASLLTALEDVRWLMEEGSGSVSKDNAWRLRYARSLASLRLVENWRS